MESPHKRRSDAVYRHVQATLQPEPCRQRSLRDQGGFPKPTRWAIFHQNLTDEDMHHGRTPDRAHMIKSPIACSEMQCGAAIGMECKLVCHIKGLARNQQFVQLKAISPSQSLQQLPGQLRILWSWSPMCPMCNALPKTHIGLEALLFSLTPQFGILHRHSIVVQSLIAKVHKIILQMQISIRGDAPNWSAAQPSLQEHHKRSGIVPIICHNFDLWFNATAAFSHKNSGKLGIACRIAGVEIHPRNRRQLIVTPLPTLDCSTEEPQLSWGSNKHHLCVVLVQALMKPFSGTIPHVAVATSDADNRE